MTYFSTTQKIPRQNHCLSFVSTLSSSVLLPVADFDFSVEDADGNPMAPGTTITVTVEGEETEVVGDLEMEVGSPNSDFSNLDQLTDYTFNINDADPDNTEEDPVQITIEVDGPNGSARETITGSKNKAAN